MDPLSTPGEGAQQSLGSRRRRASTFSSPTLPRPNIDRVDSSSDPGHGYYSFSNSSAEPQSVPIEHLRPFTQGSTTSRNAAGHSYAEISSATQSFVSMDSQSGPTDIPHTSTHRSSTESDSADEAVDNTPPGQPQPHPPIESGDDTVRQPAPVVPRSPLEHIVQPSDTPAYPIQEPLEIDSKNIPTTATDTSPPEVPAKAESVHSQKVETQAVPASRTSTSPKVASSNRDRDQRLSTPSRQDSTINVISRPSDAITPTTSHPPLPTEPRKSITNSQRLSIAPAQLPPTKTEPDHASANGPDSTDAQRPPLPSTVSQMNTQYVNMLLALDGIPKIHNIMASFFTWILLAGFVLFPGTFTSLQEANGEGLGSVGAAVLGSIAHLPLFVIAWVCTGVGAIGMCYLWYRWQANYIWLVDRIFMPGLLNSLAGVISTLANVLGVHHATFSLSSKSTIIVTGGLACICGGLTAFYTFFLIRNVKKKHDEEIGKQRAGRHGEGFVDLSKRKMAG